MDADAAAVIASMERVAERVYWLMFAAGVGAHAHAMIEFCGLISAYVNTCRDALARGYDFRQCNVHTGLALPMPAHRAAYIAEKLGCIYGPSIAADPAVADAFRRGLGL